jgi:hypothetical protein
MYSHICMDYVYIVRIVLDRSGQRSVMGFCKRGSKLSGLVKGGEFLDKLRDYCIIKKNFLPWS